MTTSSNPISPDSPEVEDIFSADDTDNSPRLEIEALDTPPEPVTAIEETIPSARPDNRRWLRIAIIGGGLLVLLGIGMLLWFWLRGQTRTVGNDDNIIINDDNINTSIDTNTDPLINTEPNTNLVNTNTTPVTNTTFTDVDHDGLSDQEELVANTNPKKRDTDEDGLSDREEVRVYLTDPRNPDTDGDGYTDGKEVENFYHPNDPDPKKRLFDLPN